MRSVISSIIALVSLVSTLTSATPLPIPHEVEALIARQTSCPAYTIINTRGTTEKQGPSVGFLIMNKQIIASKPGGRIYDTVYNADLTQVSLLGTWDILREIEDTLAVDPNHCFFVEGYSQGASATVDAVVRIPAGSPAFNAVKGVFLIGNPKHKAGLVCNVDLNGGDSTRDVNGLEVIFASLPDVWVPKTVDVCALGDGVCDTKNGLGINPPHFLYESDAGMQSRGANFALNVLNA